MNPDELDVAYLPDPELAYLHLDKNLSDATKRDLTSRRLQELMDESDAPSMSAGGGGYYAPNLNAYSADDEQNAIHYQRQEKLKKELAGKSVLNPTGDRGVYSASTFDASGKLSDASIGRTNDPAAKGTPGYDPNATGSERFFYDAQGKRMSAAAIAQTKTGKDFAAAGWDIGYGPGMIGPGVKADTSERDARIAFSRVDPTPPMPSSSQSYTSSTPPPPPAKTAPIDTVLFDDDSVPIEVMADLIFENIGGQELINIARNDIINGQKVSYSPIKNLTSIQQQYNPNNIVSLQSTSDKYFANFPIDIDKKIPNQGNGPAGSNVYIEESTGDLIIETINIESDEQVDVQIAISGTIYEVNI